jgi:hypothetical protein
MIFEKVNIMDYVENRSLCKPRIRLEDNIKMDLKEIGWEYLNWK